jgi:hypothetical protein
MELGNPYATRFPILRRMNGHPDEGEWREEAAMEEFIEEELRGRSEAPIFDYLARYGDAIDVRVAACRAEAASLMADGHHGAALFRATVGIEVAIRFFIVRPKVQGAFLSDDWAQSLTERILERRTAEDRKLLPAILRAWGIDITAIKLSDNSQLWETILKRLYPLRDSYAHAGGKATIADAAVAIECLDLVLSAIVGPIAKKLGFTRDETGRWDTVLSAHDRRLNPARVYESESPFKD